MPKIFLSYAHADGSAAADMLYTRLVGAGYAVWKDNYSLRLGAPFVAEITQAIESHEHVLLVVSSAALQSHWVDFETNLAETARQRIVPILIDGLAEDKLPLNVRMRHCLRMGQNGGLALHQLVNHLEGTAIPRIVNLSGHALARVTNALVLEDAPFRKVDLREPDAVRAYGIELAQLALPYLQQANAGLVPPGLAAVACVTLAYLLGEWNALPRLYVPHRYAEGSFQIDGAKSLALQDVRELGFQNRSRVRP